MLEIAPTPASETPPARRTSLVYLRDRLRWSWRIVAVRFRFLALLALVGVTMAEWDLLRNLWDKLTRGAIVADPATQIVSADTEYFCPMDPGVLSDWPGKCPICNMALVRRARGDVTPLPGGVISRMQLSPYRLQLAGLKTEITGYRPLASEVTGPGHVTSPGPDRAEVELDLFASEMEGLSSGATAEVMASDPEPFAATVIGLSPTSDGSPRRVLARLQVDDPRGRLKAGQSVRGTITIPAATREPFSAQPSDPLPIRTGERRTVFVCPEHPDVLREQAERCPRDQKPLERRDLLANQRIGWWCPMHPDVTADMPGSTCSACGGMRLVPRVITYRPRGEVLAVPESAVIDTGTRTIVYVERMPGMVDGVEVVLGPRCGGAYPVVRGLEPGQRVVSVGGFLVDAETRLNPSLAAGYFGAARSAGPTVTATTGTAIAKPAPSSLASPEADLIARQKVCPVTGKPLGSMGKPVRVEVAGRTVFVCCEGCEPALRSTPEKYLARLKPDPAPDPRPAP